MLEVRDGDANNSSFIIQRLWPLWFHVNFKIVFYFSEESYWNFDEGCIGSVHQGKDVRY